MIGVGRLGGALAIALARAEYQIVRLVHRSAGTAAKVSRNIASRVELSRLSDVVRLDSDIVLVACPDQVMEEMVREMRAKTKGGQIVLHTSGSLSSEVLSPLRNTGAAIGSMHPLASISDPIDGASRFEGTYFCVEGDAPAVKVGRQMAKSLGANPFAIDPGSKPLYHASAVMAAGHTVALFDAACEVLSACGVEINMTRKILLPLIRTSIDNLKTQPPDRALTGTYARADASTAEKHLMFLKDQVRSETVEIYIDLALRSVELALRAGGNGQQLAKIQDLILMAKADPGVLK